MCGWEHFHHQADIGVRGRGETLEEAFAQAATALTAVITDPAKVAPRKTMRVECEAPDRELLLADWLNALVFEMSTRHMLFSRFDVHIDGKHLSASLGGEPIDRERHRPAVEVKGATYTALRVSRDERGAWMAQAVVDV